MGVKDTSPDNRLRKDRNTLMPRSIPAIMISGRRMNMQDISAILFDVDDTLYDRALAQEKILDMVVNKFIKVLGAYDRNTLREAWSESDRLATIEFESKPPAEFRRDTRARDFLRLLGVTMTLADAITDLYLEEYPSINATVVGADELIRKLSRQYKVGAVSNSLADVQYRKLETTGLRRFLSCIVLSDEFGIRKPDRRIFEHAAALLGAPPAKCLFVGDSFPSDVVGSHLAGMRSCWFNRKRDSVPGGNIKPDFQIYELREVEKILKSWSTF